MFLAEADKKMATPGNDREERQVTTRMASVPGSPRHQVTASLAKSRRRIFMGQPCPWSPAGQPNVVRAQLFSVRHGMSFGNAPGLSGPTASSAVGPTLPDRV